MFDGVICMDAMEHICPEDYPGILRGFQEALKPGGVLYFTADRAEEPDFDLEVYYAQAKALGLPVVFGEVAQEAIEQRVKENLEVPEEGNDPVYHYYPPLAQVRAWIDQAGLAIEAGRRRQRVPPFPGEEKMRGPACPIPGGLSQTPTR